MKKLGLFVGMLALSSALWSADIVVNATDKDLGTALEGVTLQTPDGKTVQTDAKGTATISIPDNKAQTRIAAKLIGYDTLKFWAKPGTLTMKIQMSIAGVVDSKELVVEQDKPGATDEQLGVSHFVNREEIKNTANFGIVEDVMSTIKALPGVGYTGSFDAKPSIQGGSPDETRTVLDGTYVLNPYQWLGAYTIFDPNMVDSAKLSDGIVSAAYGQVLSGLLEVNSRTPSSDQVQFDGSISTTGIDAWLRAPLGPNAGMLVGSKVTWMEVAFALAGQSSAFAVAPYIRNAYLKTWWKPSNTLSIDTNAFLGSDGVGGKQDSQDESLVTTGEILYQHQMDLASIRLQDLLSDHALLGISFAWNREDSNTNFSSVTNGTKGYDQAFIAKYGAPLTPTFTLDNLTTNLTNDQDANTFEGKVNLDLEVATNQVLSFGVESVYELSTTAINGSQWQDSQISPGNYKFTDASFGKNTNGNSLLVSGAYSTFNFNIGSGLLTGEAGVRLDLASVWNTDFTINAPPTVNPRIRLNLTPVRNVGVLDSFSISGGSGLYSQVPDDANELQKQDASAGDLQPSRVWANELGLEAEFEDGWKISAEAYYKYYLNRGYIIGSTGTTTQTFSPYTNGTGYAAGFDVFLQRRTSRFWDGWLTYSYNITRYKNPTAAAYSGQTTLQGDPLNTDYYPSWQRFHTINFISNWKPVEGFSILLQVAVATGSPETQGGPISSYGTPGAAPGGGTQVIERFVQIYSYSDTLRTDISCPVDIKATWYGYFANSKVQWSFYAGVQNIFGSIYSPTSNGGIDGFYGNTLKGSSQADFTIPFPIPSIGFKISY